MPDQPAELNIATELFKRTAQKAIARQLTVGELFNGAATLQSMGERQLVAELYKTWIAYNGDNEVLYAIYFNYGVSLNDARDHAGAINAFRESIRLKPDFEPPYINLGRVLEDIGQIGAAVNEWMKLVGKLSAVTGDTVAHKLTVLHQAGRVLESHNHDSMAEDVLKQSLDINPHQVEAMQHWISLRQRQCKWPVVAEWERVKRKDLLNGISTLSLANLADDPMFQLAKAYRYARQSIGMPKAVRPSQGAAGRADPQRLKIGYVSSDLREHAVGFAMTDVMEQHDHKNFEIFAYYCGINRPDSTQARIQKAVDHWTDINGLSDDDAAAKIAADGIDILVDLNGYTKDARTKVFARRPAPIIVNWFGYPNSMGTPYHHYLIADDYIVPPGDEIYYSEKHRAAAVLPAQRSQTRHLGEASDAGGGGAAGRRVCVLLLQWHAEADGAHLSALDDHSWPRAGQRAVAFELARPTPTSASARSPAKPASRRSASFSRIRWPIRIIWRAIRWPIFSSTVSLMAPTPRPPMPCGWACRSSPFRDAASRRGSARTWSGRPVSARWNAPRRTLTWSAPSSSATTGRSLSPSRQKLVAGRDTCLLFDTPKLVRHLEDAYRQMWSALLRGAVPVPDLRNLDVYHEIGLGLDLENIETLSDEAYLALYQEKLAEWHSAYPIEPDARFWRDTPAQGQTAVQSLGARRAVA